MNMEEVKLAVIKIYRARGSYVTVMMYDGEHEMKAQDFNEIHGIRTHLIHHGFKLTAATNDEEFWQKS